MGKPWCGHQGFYIDDRVIATVEKHPVSNLSSTGLYHFSHAKDFTLTFECEVKRPATAWQQAELYIAPLYNHLIKAGKDIRYHRIGAKRGHLLRCTQ
ncbi:hypothetical protein [Shewanella sp. NIFS-20-20]|uniref:hypothetical protein n=1 Tax=Shewanella sp. NIFS-20-20 TaxID=2853806 RepID=UPI0035294C7E